MPAKVYIFRGSPASGKSTLTPVFCKEMAPPVALLKHDMFRWHIHAVDRAVEDVSAEEHLFAFENLKALFERYLISGRYTVVVEGLFTWDDKRAAQGNVRELLALAQKHGATATSIVLKAGKNTLLARNAARSWEVPRGEFEELYNNVYKTIDASEVVIDSTRQSLEETLKDIRNLAKASPTYQPQ